MESNETLEHLARIIAFTKQDIFQLETFLNQSLDINHDYYFLPTFVKAAVQLKKNDYCKDLTYWIEKFNEVSGYEVIKDS